MSSQEWFRDALRRVIDEVVAPGAAAVDAQGSSPARRWAPSARPGCWR